MESGQLPGYQWRHTRRAAAYFEQMDEYDAIQEPPFAQMRNGLLLRRVYIYLYPLR